MQRFSLLEKSNCSFGIEWKDKQCKHVLSHSANLDRFIDLKLLDNGDFSSLICESQDVDLQEVDSQAAESRQSRLTQLDSSNTCTVKYRVTGLNGAPLYVSEETFIDADGCYVSVFTDITKTVEEKNKLIEVTERLELVLNGTRLGMWDWNPQTNDVIFDERWAEMLGLKLSDLTQTLADWQDRVHPDDIDDCFADITAHVEGKVEFYENTHRMMHTDGEWRYILDRGRVVERDNLGNPVRFTGTHTDVTSLKLAEQAAHEALSARNKFFARMSHEIRTPLHGILGTADILAKNDLSSDDRHLVSIINDTGQLLQTLLNDLLDIAKIEEDALEMAIRECDVMPALKTVFKLFAQKAKSKGLKFQFQNTTQQQAIYVKTDVSRINQIVSNTLSNAIKFTQEGFVSLKIEILQGKLILSVQDSGIGIQDTSTIFDPYKQEGTRESKSMGTGLGLSIVKALCEKLNIRLELNSKPDAGTTFTFHLGKVLSKSENISKTPDVKTSYDKQPLKKKVLVVDDNEINLFIAKTMLEEFFEEVDIALNGPRAIALVKMNQDYDIVFMDLNMPEMDGIEASAQINQLDLEHPPLIVAQTADATEEAKLLFESTNVKHIITKPFTKDKLIGLIYNLDGD